MPHDGVIWLLAVIVWYSAVLYGGWPYNYKFGGPRGGGAAGRHTHERGGWGWCKERGPRAGRRWRAGALGAGRGGHIESPYHPRTRHWSRQGKPETLGVGAIL
jgi:hypothetical protein